MADDSTKFEIHIVSDADNTGFKSATTSVEGITDATKKNTDATEAGNKSGEKSEILMERLGISHRSFHEILHLIGSQSGPAASAAVAGIGLAAGGGMTIAILAVQELVNVFNEAQEAADQLAASARAAFATTTDEANKAQEAVDKASNAIDEFYTNLARGSAETDAKNAFAAQIQAFKNIAGSAEAAGLINKKQGDEFVQQRTAAAETGRADALDRNTAALNEQLRRLQAFAGSADAAKQTAELAALQEDQKNLLEAYKSGAGYTLKSSAKNSVGGLNAWNGTTDHWWNPGNSDNSENRKQSFTIINDVIEREIKLRTANNETIDKHIKLLEEEITRRTGEAQSLKSDVDKSQSAASTQDFARGRSIADQFNKTGSVSDANAQFLIVLEQAITGQKLTFAQAVSLIQLQTQNIDVAIQLLGNAHGRISVVEAKLAALAAQSQQTAVTH